MSTPTQSQLVKEFTEQSRGMALPTHPRRMTRADVEFLVKMNCGELMELLVTVTAPQEDPCQLLMRLALEAERPAALTQEVLGDDVAVMAEQVDALVDVAYYNLNGAAKVGFNVDQVFQVVHRANMAKRSPEDGQFHRNTEGKVVKPEGWQEPDVKAVVERWMADGTW